MKQEIITLKETELKYLNLQEEMKELKHNFSDSKNTLADFNANENGIIKSVRDKRLNFKETLDINSFNDKTPTKKLNNSNEKYLNTPDDLDVVSGDEGIGNLKDISN